MQKITNQKNAPPQLSDVFRGINVWDFFSVSKIKNSMYCPSYLEYLSKGVREKKIITPEGVAGSKIHAKLDVTEKVEAAPEEAAAHNAYALAQMILDVERTQKPQVLTELPYFSPTRKIFGFPDTVYVHYDGGPRVSLVERKTRNYMFDNEGAPYIFADDAFQLHIQKNILSDILGFIAEIDGNDLFSRCARDMDSYVELRDRGSDPDALTAGEFTREMESAMSGICEVSRKGVSDSYSNFDIALEYGQTEKTLMCRVDAGNKVIADRFDYVTSVLLEKQPVRQLCGNCSPMKRKYCGYSHLCGTSGDGKPAGQKKQVGQTSLSSFL